MKSILKRSLAAALTLVTVCGFPGAVPDLALHSVQAAAAAADGSETDDLNVIPLNGSITDALTSKNDVKEYQFTLTENGYLNIDFARAYIESDKYYWTMSLYDTTAKQNLIYTTDYAGNAQNQEIVTSRTWNLGLEKGTYTIKIETENSYYYSGEDYTLTVNFTQDDNWETEFNETAGSADPLTLNQGITGSLRSKNDVDYYTFEIDEYGYLNIDFARAYIDSDKYYWTMSLYDTTAKQNLIYTTDYSGNAQNSDIVTSRTWNLGLEKGTYIIKIETENSYYYSGEDYTLTVNFTQDDNWETEFNETAGSADPLTLNQGITGSLRSKADVDYYTFEIGEYGYLNIDFARAYIDDSHYYWKMSLYDTTAKQNLIYTTDYSGNAQNSDIVTSRTWNLGLEKGTYTIKIETESNYYYSGEDYTLTVNFTQDDNRETEFNETTGSADPLTLNQGITGSLRSKTDVDYYTFEIDEYGYINIDFARAYIDDSHYYWKMSLYDNATKPNLIYTTNYSGNAQNKDIVTSRSWALGLEKGIYIIKIETESNYYYSGEDYTLTVNFTHDEHWEREINNSVETADQLPLNGSISGTNVDGSADYYQFTLERDDVVSLDFSRSVYSDLDSKDKYWVVELYDTTPTKKLLQTMNVMGNVDGADPSITTLSNVKLEKGTYTVVVKPGTYTAYVPYTLTLRNDSYVKKIKGDLNADGKFDIGDAVLLQKWLLAIPDTVLADWEAGDMNADGKLNAADLTLMKQALMRA